MKELNYPPEVTKELVELYEQGIPVPELAAKFERTEKSIIGKLAKEGVYKKKVYLSKLGTPPETKKEIIARIALLLELNPETIQGLEKAPKLELRLVESQIKLHKKP